MLLAPWRRAATLKPLSCLPKMDDGVPFLHTHVDQGVSHAAVICLVEKVGSTTWKLLLLQGLRDLTTRASILTHSPHGAPASPCSAEWLSIAPRFLLVRNPYSRLLSGFLDKCLLQRWKIFFHAEFDCPSEVTQHGAVTAFAHFVEVVARLELRRNGSQEPLDSHFSPQARHCDVESGYDYYLPVEQMPRWYGPFISVLGLEQVARSGWNITTKWWKGHKECFYSPPGRGCDGSVESVVRQGPASFHYTGSDAQLGAYYTPRLARLVSAAYKKDFSLFGVYPEWDGRNANAYLDSISTQPRRALGVGRVPKGAHTSTVFMSQ